MVLVFASRRRKLYARGDDDVLDRVFVANSFLVLLSFNFDILSCSHPHNHQHINSHIFPPYLAEMSRCSCMLANASAALQVATPFYIRLLPSQVGDHKQSQG